jgi:TP901 family phage tail tape measure protein
VVRKEVGMAASRIQGITVEIGGDTTKLSNALKDVNKSIRETQSELKDVNKLLKLDPGNTDLIAQKQKYLSQAISDTKDKLKTEQEALKQLKAGPQTEETIKQQEALTREIADTEQQLKSLSNEYKNFGSVAGAQLQAAGSKMQEVGGKISDVGGTLTKSVTVPLAAVGAAGAANFAEVDKTMQLANKTMGNTAEQANLVNEAMKNAAANSTYGMSDASNAVLNFARAGLNAEQSAATLAPAMNLAAGEGGNLDTVSAGLVATINGFHGSFDEAGKYADVFAAACNNSALDINTLSESMSTAAPMFSAAGYTVEDATLALGLMGNAGIDANTAANSLKTGLARLVSPAKEGAEALEQLGFSSGGAEEQAGKLAAAQTKLKEATATCDAKQASYNEKVAKYGANSSQALNALASLTKAQDKQASAQQAVNLLTEAGQNGMSSYGALMVDAEGNMRPFEDVLKDLQSAFGGLSSEQQIAAASAIFGKNQMTSWLALIQTSPDKVDDLSASIHACDGTTQEMADTMMSGFGGSIESLKSSIDVLTYSLGETLAPIFQKVIDAVQGVVDKLNAMDPATRQVVVTIGLVAAAIGPVLLAIGKTITAVGTITSAIGTVMTHMGALTGGITALSSVGLLPMIGIIAGVVAAIVAVVEIVKHWGEITEWFGGVWDKICSGVKSVGQGLASFFTGLWNGIKSGTETAWNGIKTAVSTVWNGMKTGASTVFNGIKEHVTTAWNNVKTKTSETWNNIKTGVSTTWNAIKTGAGTTFSGIKDNITNAWNTVKANTSTAWTGIKSVVQQHGGGIKGVISTAIDGYKSIWKAGFDVINQVTGGRLGDALSSARSKLSDIKNAFSEKMNGAKDAVKSAIDRIKSFFNFSWSLPRLKMPHISISGRFSINPPSAPHFSISWYKKAMENGMILDSPTIFGMKGNTLLGGGEAGDEAIVGVESLMSMIQKAVGTAKTGTTVGDINITVYGAPGQDVSELADIIESRINSKVNMKEAVFS